MRVARGDPRRSRRSDAPLLRKPGFWQTLFPAWRPARRRRERAGGVARGFRVAKVDGSSESSTRVAEVPSNVRVARRSRRHRVAFYGEAARAFSTPEARVDARDARSRHDDRPCANADADLLDPSLSPQNMSGEGGFNDEAYDSGMQAMCVPTPSPPPSFLDPTKRLETTFRGKFWQLLSVAAGRDRATPPPDRATPPLTLPPPPFTPTASTRTRRPTVR